MGMDHCFTDGHCHGFYYCKERFWNGEEVEKFEYLLFFSENPKMDQHVTLAEELRTFEEALSLDDSIYDFKITREKTKDLTSILYFNIRYNDYIKALNADKTNPIIDRAVRIGVCAKNVGFRGAVIDMRTTSDNKRIAYKLV